MDEHPAKLSRNLLDENQQLRLQEAELDTRLASSQRQNAQAQRMETIGQITIGIAHEFNNSLTVINGAAELLGARIPSEDHQTLDLVENILTACHRAARLTRQIMNFGSRTQGQVSIVTLNETIEETASLLSQVISKRTIISTDLAPDLWSVRVDVTQIEQLIVNLVLNAHHDMHDGGRITIEATNLVLDKPQTNPRPEIEPGEYVLLAVSDNGPGLNPESRDQLYAPPLDTDTTVAAPSLGPATVHALVKQNKGSIRVYSEVSQGTTIKVYLPRWSTSATAKTIVQPVDSMPAGNETILLVEDDHAMREVTQIMLADLGYSVLEAHNANEAQKISEAYPGVIHLLITDVIMPGLGGGELSQRLIQDRPLLKTLFVSGYADRAIVQHGILDNEAPFLQKPFSPLGLARKVRDVLDEKRK
jgi:two-component system, cell cycle sensor histidine kinase and response regulator CckA